MWIVVLVGAVFAILSLVNLYAQVIYSFHGTEAPGVIMTTEKASARSHSVVAKVNVVPHDEQPLSTEIEDTLGVHDWKQGDSVPMLCTRLHADHVSCVANLWIDRYAFSLGMLGIGALALWGGLRRKR